ncbi:MAG: nucleotidyltransferase family protein [Candidatus Atribacteria bacterium]|nr:nucleotidyltransferase family protein [Candidatus Atribacteria bacterium]MCD6350333.1 nucleotidyltransferase family protein [Candidatus Atribacteria bacterium]
MTRKELIQKLRENREKLREFGVKRIGIFGSFARDEARENSDVDVVVELERGKGTFSNVARLIEFLENLFGREIDLLTPDSIDTIRLRYVKERIEKEVIYV